MVDEEPAFLNEGPVQIESSVVNLGHAYWRSKILDGRLPSRSQIDPAEIPRLLPHVMLLDVEREPDWDFRYRLVGTRVVEHLFRDHTGSRFSEIEHQRAPNKVFQNCRRVAETGRPLLANTEYVGPHQGFRRAEDVMLPLADDGATVDTILFFIQYMSKL